MFNSTCLVFMRYAKIQKKGLLAKLTKILRTFYGSRHMRITAWLMFENKLLYTCANLVPCVDGFAQLLNEICED